MQSESNIIVYTPADSAGSGLPALRLTLEPERVPTRSNRATLADIDSMVALARSGASARNHQGSRCKWATWDENGDLLVRMKLYVWPSELDLPYTLTLPSGVTSSPPVLVRARRTTRGWVAGASGAVELPWRLYPAGDDVLGFALQWHNGIGVWDAWSAPAAPPAIRPDGARLHLEGDEDVYGVLDIRGIVVGYRHTLTIRYPTGRGGASAATDSGGSALYVAGGGAADGPAISVTSADDFDVRATWTDENGTTREESATITIPECVKSMLKKCPTGTRRAGNISIRHGGDGTRITVYYNACTGAVLGIRRTKK